MLTDLCTVLLEPCAVSGALLLLLKLFPDDANREIRAGSPRRNRDMVLELERLTREYLASAELLLAKYTSTRS